MNIGETTKLLKACDTTHIVPLIEGKHGIGKSQITMQYAIDNEMHCEQLILSLMDTADLLGMPIIRNVGGSETTIWAAPSWYSRIVNAAWPVEMKVNKLRFNDKEFENYVLNGKAHTFGDKITREYLNTLYCDYYEVPNDRLHLLTQNAVGYIDAKRSVLFLDEFNRAPADILNASLQLILDKRLNDHVLPVVNGQPTLVVAAINPSNSQYTVNDLDPALLDRFLNVEVEIDAKEWLEYARSKGINDIIRNFISEQPNKLHFEPEDGGITATPRSWEGLSRFMDNIKQIDTALHFPIIKGMVGSEIGSQFLQYFMTYSKAVKFVDVEKRVKELLKNESDIDKVGEVLAEELTNRLEIIQQMDLASSFYKKYISKKPKDALPLLAFLYSMPLEQATAFIVESKKTDPGLDKFGAIDELNSNKLLLRILNASRNVSN